MHTIQHGEYMGKVQDPTRSLHPSVCMTGPPKKKSLPKIQGSGSMGTLPVHNRSNNENMEEILKIIQKETEIFEKPTDKDDREGYMTLNV